jgi:hypothetical protein
MGNNTSRESRGPESPSLRPPESTGGSGPTSPTDRQHHVVYTSRVGRGTRPDLSFLGIGSSSANSDQPERRETKQEREARKLEKERLARAQEREKSIKEEHVDGGFVVTMGVYTGTEDFNKTVVRQLMVWLADMLLAIPLTDGRLNVGLRLSGEVSMISRKIGLSIN